MMYNRDTFYKYTKAVFRLVESRNESPDYISDSGSRYWFTDEGVYRASDHWFDVGNQCYWMIEHPEHGIYWSPPKTVTGFARWDQFAINHNDWDDAVADPDCPSSILDNLHWGDTVGYWMKGITHPNASKDLFERAIEVHGNNIRVLIAVAQKCPELREKCIATLEKAIKECRS